MVRRFEIDVMIFCAMIALFVQPIHANALNGFDLTNHAIPLKEIRPGGPPRDGIPAIINPRFVSTSLAKYMKDEDRVLGITGTRVAKAYPIKILNWHEIVNDTLEGKPIVITYCPLCGTGIGFDRLIDENLVTFGVSGLLYQSDLLMYDHQTESLWSQIGMEAVAGELTGRKLTHLFLEHVTWKDWREAHPNTLVLSTNTGYRRDYNQSPYMGYAQQSILLFPTSVESSRFHSKAWVLGLEVNGVFKAYPFSELEKSTGGIRDKIAGQTLMIHFNKTGMSASVRNEKGFLVPSVSAYWFAWYAFHPDTLVYEDVLP